MTWKNIQPWSTKSKSYSALLNPEIPRELSFAEFMEAILELRGPPMISPFHMSHWHHWLATTGGTNSAKVKDIVDLRKFVAQAWGASRRAARFLTELLTAVEGDWGHLRAGRGSDSPAES